MPKKDYYGTITLLIIIFSILIWLTCSFDIKENLTLAPWQDTLTCLNLNDEQVKKLFGSLFNNINDDDLQGRIFEVLQKEGYKKDEILKCIFQEKEVKEEFQPNDPYNTKYYQIE